MLYLAFLYFFDLMLVLRPRELIDPFPDITKLSFGSEDVILILSILPKFNEMYKILYLSPSLIYLCFLTLRQLNFFTLTGVNSPSVKFTSQDIFQVEQPW